MDFHPTMASERVGVGDCQCFVGVANQSRIKDRRVNWSWESGAKGSFCFTTQEISDRAPLAGVSPPPLFPPSLAIFI